MFIVNACTLQDVKCRFRVGETTGMTAEIAGSSRGHRCDVPNWNI